MKILSVRGENLASLESFSVEFDRGPLASAGVFAITGPTGAGKSTLLDAICLALYGRTPRAPGGKGGVPVGRAGEDMVEGAHWLSSLDPRGVVRRGAARGWAEVRFRGRDGRVYRARWDARRSGRVDGLMQAPVQSLVDEQRAVPIGEKFREVKELIADRVGLTFEQFQRSVLLAQGEFAAFLRAAHHERAQLLEQLTGQWIYGRISQLAFEEAKRAREEAERQEREVAALRQRLLSPAEIEALQAQRHTLEATDAEERRKREEAQAAGAWYRQWDRLMRERAELLRAEGVDPEGAGSGTPGAGDALSTRIKAEIAAAEAAEGCLAALAAFDAADTAARQATEAAERRRAAEVAAERAAEAARTSLNTALSAAQSLDPVAPPDPPDPGVPPDLAPSLAEASAPALAPIEDAVIDPLVSLDKWNEAAHPDASTLAAEEATLEGLERAVLWLREAPPALWEEGWAARAGLLAAIRAAEARVAAVRAAIQRPQYPISPLSQQQNLQQAQSQGRVAGWQAGWRAGWEAGRAAGRAAAGEEGGIVLSARLAAAEAGAALKAAISERAAAVAAARAAGAARGRAAAALEGALGGRSPEEIRAAGRAPDQLRSLRERLSAWGALEGARRRLEEARPTMPREEARAWLARPDSREAVRASVEIGARLEADSRRRAEIAARAPEIVTALSERDRWGALNTLIGSADGKRLRSFAQGMSLDVLIGHANANLQLLSRRYRVERAPNPLRRPEDDMNLQVSDLHLGGQARPMSSLSGGELFLVSLAMALGLAALAGDRAQVGTILIDEGFGSLDAQALDVAISALEVLAADDRHVGIVSHVGALTERVGVQVRVSRQGSGRSTVKVVTTGG